MSASLNASLVQSHSPVATPLPDEGGERAERSLPCAVCGARRSETVSTRQELRRQDAEFRLFRARRFSAARETRTAGAAGLVARPPKISPTEGVTAIERCLECGLLFRCPPPSSGRMPDLDSFMSDSEARLLETYHRQQEWAERKVLLLARWLWKFGRVRPSVLDVGSFVGGFVAVAKMCGWDVLGVEPAPRAARFCRERGLPVQRGWVTCVDSPPARYDAVTIWDAFHRLPDPHPTLDAVRRLVRPGGVLVVRVPNGECFRWLASRKGKNGWLPTSVCTSVLAWNNLLGFPYRYGYSRPTLDTLVAKYGFRHLCSYPDILMPSAGFQTNPRGAREQRLSNGLCRVAGRFELAIGSDRLYTAPWVDYYYRVVA